MKVKVRVYPYRVTVTYEEGAFAVHSNNTDKAVGLTEFMDLMITNDMNYYEEVIPLVPKLREFIEEYSLQNASMISANL
ncbi:hypothetical protein POF51_29580 [Brevibacillus sp. AG]|uniref:hypothetical protein n=1 Tax=Brevibacillus sp. AG TaxID=3020891 RepID=UPI00232F6137|nr:hypothetical protein [Brevibacillus sp. AG]MDC0764876.1 hypothetical protein [Brevibacillus sp. AG]